MSFVVNSWEGGGDSETIKEKIVTLSQCINENRDWKKLAGSWVMNIGISILLPIFLLYLFSSIAILHCHDVDVPAFPRIRRSAYHNLAPAELP